MMGVHGFKTKKEFKEKATGKDVRDVIVETSMFGPEAKENGRVCVVGPDAYRDRKWYATVETKNWIVVKVS